jgi:S-adenosylmethionine:tRNA ribosyltransferase-isomerase
MPVDVFDFPLPDALIAQRPVRPRDAARLLVVGQDGLADRGVRDLPSLLSAGDLLVFNDTKVIRARLRGRRGAVAVEVTLHRHEAAGLWRAFARPARRLHTGDRVAFADDLAALVVAKGEGGEVVLDFACQVADLMAQLDRHGRLPLPPYIRRPADREDETDYQTVFASRPGAVAAPTAGLHFTPRLLAALAAAGIERTTLTLHVGAGTFLPVKAAMTAGHVMHAEWGEIGAAAVAAIAAARARGGRIVAVGTTTLRLLESAATAAGDVKPWSGETTLFITPGYRFKLVERLITNFHLPRSTLFMLVAAFSGLDRMQAAYRHAVAAGYRFYSYGDACLLERQGVP